jgi:UrcA family protein
MTKLMFAAAAAALLAGPALAETTQIQVRITNVDFNNRAQVQDVYARINEAARQACTTPSDNKYVAAPDRECMARAVAEAVRATNKPLLTAAYDSSANRANRALAGNDQ